jgi:hypothetical protein
MSAPPDSLKSFAEGSGKRRSSDLLFDAWSIQHVRHARLPPYVHGALAAGQLARVSVARDARSSRSRRARRSSP